MFFDDGQIFSFLLFEKQVHIARLPKRKGVEVSSSWNHESFFASGSPWSPTSILIHGIFETFQGLSHYPLRKKIYVNYSPSELCYGMAKVAGKGLKDISELPSFLREDLLTLPVVEYRVPDPDESQESQSPNCSQSLLEKFCWETKRELKFRTSWTNKDWMNFVKYLRTSLCQHQSEPRYRRDRAVVAILVSKQGELIEVAMNSNRTNKIQHAEWNLVKNYWQRHRAPLPKGCRVYTSRKCCKMCAGLLWHCTEDPTTLHVFYDEDDLGPFAKSTLFNCGSDEQKRILTMASYRDFETKNLS